MKTFVRALLASGLAVTLVGCQASTDSQRQASTDSQSQTMEQTSSTSSSSEFKLVTLKVPHMT